MTLDEKKIWMLLNDVEMQKWIEQRLQNGITYTTEREMYGGVSRPKTLIDSDGAKFFCLWTQLPTQEWLQLQTANFEATMNKMLGYTPAESIGCIIVMKFPFTDGNEMFRAFASKNQGMDKEDLLEIADGIYDEFKVIRVDCEEEVHHE